MVSLLAPVYDGGILTHESSWSSLLYRAHLCGLSSQSAVIMDSSSWESLDEGLRGYLSEGAAKDSAGKLFFSKHGPWPMVVGAGGAESLGGVMLAGSIDEAIALSPHNNALILGGQSLYEEAVARAADTAFIARFHDRRETYGSFPLLDGRYWALDQVRPGGEFDFEIWNRKPSVIEGLAAELFPGLRISGFVGERYRQPYGK